MQIIIKYLKEYKIQNLIIIALVLSPFTLLRVWLIGITEVSMIIFILIVLLGKHKNISFAGNDRFIFTKFWIVFMIFGMIGSLNNFIISKHMSGLYSSLLFDVSSYFMSGMTCFAMEIYLLNNKIDYNSIYKRTYLFISIILFILFVYSQISSELFGLPLRYYHYFNPLASNIHHVSMVIVPLPFIGLKLVSSEKKPFNKFMLLLMVLSNLATGINTGSLKILIGFTIGLIVFLYTVILKRVSNKSKYLYSGLLSIVILIIVLVRYDDIIKFIVNVFTSEDIGSGREVLWKFSINKIMDSPLFGYGPGSHAQYYSWYFSDAHSSFLTIALQGGLFAIVAYLSLQWKITRSISKDKYLVGSYIGILVYALGGDILRRLPTWIFLVIFYYSSQKISNENNKEIDDERI